MRRDHCCLSARLGGADLSALRQNLAHALPSTPLEQTDFERAADVMAALSQGGLHRAVKVPVLLSAAAAERADLMVMH